MVATLGRMEFTGSKNAGWHQRHPNPMSNMASADVVEALAMINGRAWPMRPARSINMVAIASRR